MLESGFTRLKMRAVSSRITQHGNDFPDLLKTFSRVVYIKQQ